MDNIIGLSLNFVFLCLGLYAVTFVLRKIVEYAVLDNPKMPGSKTSKFWTDVFLPIAPVVNGILFGAFAKMYPWPVGFSSFTARVIIGLAAGALSGTVYRVVQALIKAKVPGIGPSVPPPAPTNVPQKLIDTVRDSIKKEP